MNSGFAQIEPPRTWGHAVRPGAFTGLDSCSTLLVVPDDVSRLGLQALIRQTTGLRHAGSVSTLAAALVRIADSRPELVVMEMGLPDADRLHGVQAVIAAQKPRHTIVIVPPGDCAYAPHVLAAGCDGLVMKHEQGANFAEAMLAVAAGESWVSAAFSTTLVRQVLQRKRHRAQCAPPVLSCRELAVLEQLRTGRSTKQISQALGISGRTVDVHRANLKRKLGLRSASELVAFASQQPPDGGPSGPRPLAGRDS